MDVLKETWKAKDDIEESVVSYVFLMQERLAMMTELVQENAQRLQKRWYDRNAHL